MEVQENRRFTVFSLCVLGVILEVLVDPGSRVHFGCLSR